MTPHWTIKEMYQRNGYWSTVFCLIMYIVTLEFWEPI